MQEIEFFNQSEDTLTSIVLNDWNHAYSSKTTPLAKRFSDEFYRGFHLAAEKERGSTNNLNISTTDKSKLSWGRTEKNPDLVTVKLDKKLAPNQKIILHLTYIVKVPSDDFTHYGYTERGGMYLRNWFLTPARFENHAFTTYNNLNLDDIANAVSDFDILLRIIHSPGKQAKKTELTTDLNEEKTTQFENFSIYKLNGKKQNRF